MNRKIRFPRPTVASLVVAAFLSATLGIGIPSTIAGLFHGPATPHVDAAATPSSPDSAA